MIKNIKKVLLDDKLGQLIRFGLVGALNTIVGYGTYWVGIQLGLNFILASVIGQILGTLNSYFWNKRFTFKSKKKSRKEFIRFCAVYVLQYILNVSLIALGIDYYELSEELSGLFATIICTIISFAGHKYYSFRECR